MRNGNITVSVVLDAIKHLPYEDLGFAKIDHHRAIRRGFPEVIFGPGKTVEEISKIGRKLVTENDCVLITRTTKRAFNAIKTQFPDAKYHTRSRAIVIDRRPSNPADPGVLVITAGTSDLPIAEEASITAELFGSTVKRINDVGIAGIHRLLAHLQEMNEATVIIVVAGMDGALPALISGLVACPVIAVPTSIGYGANFDGLAALLTMLNSCSPGTSVVNIDNGFGAGYLAGSINRLAAHRIKSEF